jgi:hypothetical protein
MGNDRQMPVYEIAGIPGGLVREDGLSVPVSIDAPIGTEKPIPEIVDYRKIAISISVVEKMELLLSSEPGKSS